MILWSVEALMSFKNTKHGKVQEPQNRFEERYELDEWKESLEDKQTHDFLKSVEALKSLANTKTLWKSCIPAQTT